MLQARAAKLLIAVGSSPAAAAAMAERSTRRNWRAVDIMMAATVSTMALQHDGAATTVAFVWGDLVNPGSWGDAGSLYLEHATAKCQAMPTCHHTSLAATRTLHLLCITVTPLQRCAESVKVTR